MSNWRIGSINGALLAAYFIPVWGMIAYDIMFAPVHALYDQPNIAAALYVSDHLNIAGMNLVRLAWLLALGRFAAIAFLVVFLVMLCWPSTRKSAACDQHPVRPVSIARRLPINWSHTVTRQTESDPEAVLAW